MTTAPADNVAPSSPEATGGAGTGTLLNPNPVTPPASAAPPSTPNPGQKSRPEWAPENFWDAEKGEVRVEDLGKSWFETKRTLSMRTDDLTKKVKEDFEKSRLSNRPETADKYELKIPDGLLPEGVDFQFEEGDPLIKFAREFAHEKGYSQDDFNSLVGAYVESEVYRVPDIEKEMGRLGEKGKERVERVENWLKSNLSRGAVAALAGVSTKAEVLIALEEFMTKAGAPAFALDDSGLSGQQVLDDALIRSWQADPRYYDPQKRDPKWIEKVEQGWAKLYPAKR
jgi:hypothetical protein